MKRKTWLRTTAVGKLHATFLFHYVVSLPLDALSCVAPPPSELFLASVSPPTKTYACLVSLAGVLQLGGWIWFGLCSEKRFWCWVIVIGHGRNRACHGLLKWYTKQQWVEGQRLALERRVAGSFRV